MSPGRTIPLSAFPDGATHPEIQLHVTATRQGNLLSLCYQLTGDLALVRLPTLETLRQRRDGLWEATCFEFFLGIPGIEAYWEFNLSPVGHWNVYHFDRYRHGMRPEMAWDTLPFTMTRSPDSFSLNLQLDLTPLVDHPTVWIMGISTVLEARDRSLSYWAMTHAKHSADFHAPQTFSLQLP